MKLIRKKIILWLFQCSMHLYRKFKTKKAWNITTAQLLKMPQHSFGNYLGAFLKYHNFELIPKVERHDAYHLLTGYSTSVKDEIALQYACFGNGKRTPYLFGVLLIGTLMLPDYLTHYRRAYCFGKQANSFHHYDFKTVLALDFQAFRHTIFTKEICQNLNHKQSYLNL